MELRGRATDLEERLKDENIPEDETEALGDELNTVYEELEQEGNSTAEARAARILHGLGFSEAMRGRTTKSFSGGWRMRISLACALFVAPTLLLLDEPTNHLDLRAVLWLEEYLCRYVCAWMKLLHERCAASVGCSTPHAEPLVKHPTILQPLHHLAVCYVSCVLVSARCALKHSARSCKPNLQRCRYKKTLVVVSHDRGFLNEVTTDIVHLHDEALHYYRGNFASFEDMYEQRRRAANKEHEKFVKQMKGASVRRCTFCAGASRIALLGCCRLAAMVHDMPGRTLQLQHSSLAEEFIATGPTNGSTLLTADNDSGAGCRRQTRRSSEKARRRSSATRSRPHRKVQARAAKTRA